MSPLSVLPGRVRYETDRLIGCKDGSVLFEESVLSVKGIIEASASHRTGRVLVRYDENIVSRSDVEGHLKKALQAVDTLREREPAPAPFPRRTAPSRGDSSLHAGHFIMEMALHAFLPAPLDLLLPAAATVFRR